MAEDVYGEKYDEVLDWLLRGVDMLDSKEAIATLDAWRELCREADRREMAHELAEWIREQANKLAGYTTGGRWIQVADKIDPDKPPNPRRRGFWNQEEWNA